MQNYFNRLRKEFEPSSLLLLKGNNPPNNSFYSIRLFAVQQSHAHRGANLCIFIYAPPTWRVFHRNRILHNTGRAPNGVIAAKRRKNETSWQQLPPFSRSSESCEGPVMCTEQERDSFSRKRHRGKVILRVLAAWFGVCRYYRSVPGLQAFGGEQKSVNAVDERYFRDFGEVWSWSAGERISYLTLIINVL